MTVEKYIVEISDRRGHGPPYIREVCCDGRKALIQAFKIIEGFDIDMKWKITRDEEIIAEGHKEPLWFK
jgi:hypothetical protein